MATSPVTLVSGPLTDAQLRDAPVPVSSQELVDPSSGASMVELSQAILRELRLMNIILAQGLNVRVSDISLIRDDPGLMS